MPIRRARHIGVSISRPLEVVYAFLADPRNLSKWASGLGHSFRQVDETEWLAETADGPIRVRFTARNAFGVLDHTVIPMVGAHMHNPMRVVANGDGSEVTFCLFQRPGMSDEAFERDADWVARDLQGLRAHLESRS